MISDYVKTWIVKDKYRLLLIKVVVWLEKQDIKLDKNELPLTRYVLKMVQTRYVVNTIKLGKSWQCFKLGSSCKFSNSVNSENQSNSISLQIVQTRYVLDTLKLGKSWQGFKLESSC